MTQILWVKLPLTGSTLSQPAKFGHYWWGWFSVLSLEASSADNPIKALPSRKIRQSERNLVLKMTEKKNTWSQRFESALHPAIARFNASIGFDIQLIEYDITNEKRFLRIKLKFNTIDVGCDINERRNM